MWAEAALTEQEVPRTWDQLISVAKKLTQYDAKGNVAIEGIALKGIEDAYINNMASQLHGYIYSADGSESLKNSEQQQIATQFVYDLYHKHKVASIDFPIFIESFATELSAMCWISAFLGGYCDAAAPDLNWGLFPGPLPSVELMPELWAWSDVGYERDLAVSAIATKEQKDAGFTFLRFLLDDDNYLTEAAVAFNMVPDKVKLLQRPEFQDSNSKVVAMMVSHSKFREDVTYMDISYVINPKGIDQIMLEHAPIKETLDRYLKDELL